MSPTTTPQAAERPASVHARVIEATLRNQSRASIDRFRRASLDAVDKRLRELDRERDLDQALEANGAALALVCVGLGVISKKWLVVPAIVCGFLLQHALQGWCPAVPLLRGLGYRTRAEIELERESMKSIRRHFSQAKRRADAPTADGIARPVPSVARSPPTRSAGAAAR